MDGSTLTLSLITLSGCGDASGGLDDPSSGELSSGEDVGCAAQPLSTFDVTLSVAQTLIRRVQGAEAPRLTSVEGMPARVVQMRGARVYPLTLDGEVLSSTARPGVRTGSRKELSMKTIAMYSVNWLAVFSLALAAVACEFDSDNAVDVCGSKQNQMTILTQDGVVPANWCGGYMTCTMDGNTTTAWQVWKARDTLIHAFDLDYCMESKPGTPDCIVGPETVHVIQPACIGDLPPGEPD